MPGSGKSEAVKVARERGLPVVRMGDLVWEEVAARGLPRDAEHVGRVASEMRAEHGNDVWAHRTVERVQGLDSDAPLVVIDGLRTNEEVLTLRKALGEDFLLVAIHTDPDERFARMQRRGRDDDSLDVDVLRERDQREMGWGIARTIALADTIVVNEGSLETFQERVAALLDRLLADAEGS